MFDCGVGTKGSVAVPAAPHSVEAVVLLHTPAAQTDRRCKRVGGESLAAFLTVSKRDREGGAFSQTTVVRVTTLTTCCRSCSSTAFIFLGRVFYLRSTKNEVIWWSEYDEQTSLMCLELGPSECSSFRREKY